MGGGQIEWPIKSPPDRQTDRQGMLTHCSPRGYIVGGRGGGGADTGAGYDQLLLARIWPGKRELPHREAALTLRATGTRSMRTYRRLVALFSTIDQKIEALIGNQSWPLVLLVCSRTDGESA